MYFFLYLLFMNVFSVFICVVDKENAKSGRWRISEKKLLFIALIGGSFAMYFTMRLIRHKTLHKKFMFGLPFLIILHTMLIAYVCKFFY